MLRRWLRMIWHPRLSWSSRPAAQVAQPISHVETTDLGHVRRSDLTPKVVMLGEYNLHRPALVSRGLRVSFSQVKYDDIAHIVGLCPGMRFRDAPTFEIDRARIPTSMFKEIIWDMQVALNQYGPPIEHQNEEARSRVLSTLMNRLVHQFRLLITNVPECIIPGRITKRGRIEYQFKVCGTLTMLFVEIKFHITDGCERLNAIAQIIAEADACDLMNNKVQFSVPIGAILTDGNSWEFFMFDSRSEHNIFKRGLINGVPEIHIPPFRVTPKTAYIQALRPVVECLYGMFLKGYIAGLEANLASSLAKSSLESTPAWARALELAKQAQAQSIAAAKLRKTGDIKGANIRAIGALDLLKKSVPTAPRAYQRDDCDLASGWDDRLCE